MNRLIKNRPNLADYSSIREYMSALDMYCDLLMKQNNVLTDGYSKLDSALDKACTKLFDEATVMGDCEDEYSFAHSPRDWREWALGMEVHDSGEDD